MSEREKALSGGSDQFDCTSCLIESYAIPDAEKREG
jgi:hypothetical protein